MVLRLESPTNKTSDKPRKHLDPSFSSRICVPPWDTKVGPDSPRYDDSLTRCQCLKINGRR